jgi:hypothetical protein
MEMPTGFLGLHLARTLHQDAGDDLQAVRHTMLNLLQKNSLFPKQIVLQLLVCAGGGHIVEGQQQAGVIVVVIDEFVCIEDEQP